MQMFFSILINFVLLSPILLILILYILFGLIFSTKYHWKNELKIIRKANELNHNIPICPKYNIKCKMK